VSSTETLYSDLIARLRRLQALESVAELLGWDDQVNLPPGAAGQRAEQQAVLAGTVHGLAADPVLGERMAALTSAGGLSSDQRAVVAEAGRDFERATKLPADFVREKAAHSSRGYHAWAKARADSDFAGYAPILETHLELARREAAYLGQADNPYDCFLDLHDPGLTAAAIEPLFAELAAGLVPLARAIAGSAGADAPPRAFLGSHEEQKEFCRDVTARIGFDYNRGRLDLSLHPFCSGSGDDVRMTIRFTAGDPLSSLYSAVHEAGHGLYEQGLAPERRGTALGRNAGMAVHESQSRMWENFVGRSRGFWRFFAPRLRPPGPGGPPSAEEAYRAVNRVKPTLIRVEADEVTYNLHIILRFEIESRLFRGELAVADLPAVWNERSAALIGLTPSTDREGVLQDVHWSGGAFGYFPSYCLGNMIAAQLWEKIEGLRPDLAEDFARGDFRWLLQWLRENIHAAGRRHPPLELVRRVTGRPLSPQPLLRYLGKKYGELYRLAR